MLTVRALIFVAAHAAEDAKRSYHVLTRASMAGVPFKIMRDWDRGHVLTRE